MLHNVSLALDYNSFYFTYRMKWSAQVGKRDPCQRLLYTVIMHLLTKYTYLLSHFSWLNCWWCWFWIFPKDNMGALRQNVVPAYIKRTYSTSNTIKPIYIKSPNSDFFFFPGGIGRVVNGAFMVLKGHRSIVNQVRFNPYTYMICSSGVEKIIKVSFGGFVFSSWSWFLVFI